MESLHLHRKRRVRCSAEALANWEDIYKPPTPPTLCDGTGNLTCPKIGVKVEYVVQGYSLQPDEETY